MHLIKRYHRISAVALLLTAVFYSVPYAETDTSVPLSKVFFAIGIDPGVVIHSFSLMESSNWSLGSYLESFTDASVIPPVRLSVFYNTVVSLALNVEYIRSAMGEIQYYGMADMDREGSWTSSYLYTDLSICSPPVIGIIGGISFGYSLFHSNFEGVNPRDEMTVSKFVFGPVLSTKQGKKGFNFLLKIPLSLPIVDAETVRFFTRVGYALKKIPLNVCAGFQSVHLEEKESSTRSIWYEGDLFNPFLSLEWSFLR